MVVAGSRQRGVCNPKLRAHMRNYRAVAKAGENAT
jgi:hypothetical protein